MVRLLLVAGFLPLFLFILLLFAARMLSIRRRVVAVIRAGAWCSQALITAISTRTKGMQLCVTTTISCCETIACIEQVACWSVTHCRISFFALALMCSLRAALSTFAWTLRCLQYSLSASYLRAKRTPQHNAVAITHRNKSSSQRVRADLELSLTPVLTAFTRSSVLSERRAF